MRGLVHASRVAANAPEGCAMHDEASMSTV